MSSYDAIVIGSGINGLVAAAELSGAGWRVCLVEANDQIGGFIASEELTEPGYLHDTFSSWHPLFVTGGAHAVLGADLARHGLTYCNTDGAVTGSVAHDGRVTVAHRDPAETAAGFSVPDDRASYLAMLERLGGEIEAIGTLLGSEMRGLGPVRPVLGMVRRGRLSGLESWTRDTVTSGRAWLRREFRGLEADHLWAPWLLHAGLSPDSASGGLMVPLLAGTIHGAGLPVVKGGAGAFLEAFHRLLDERNVEIRTGHAVERVVVEGGVAIGVEVGGVLLRARRAVLASVTPAALYEQLLPQNAVPDVVRSEARRFRFGRAAMQVHVALSEPLEWSSPDLAGIPLVHLSDGSSSTGIACAEAEAGLLPRQPTVVVGQQFLMDPSRVPENTGSLWLQMQEVPYHPVGDSAGELEVSAGWTDNLVSGYVERVMGLLERHAPGTTSKVLSTTTLSPVDLERRNRNAVHGDPYGGSAELDQNLWWRPGPLTGRHRTSIGGLWHIGASTHPGPGLGGGSGHLVAQALTGGGPSRRLVDAAKRHIRR